MISWCRILPTLLISVYCSVLKIVFHHKFSNQSGRSTNPLENLDAAVLFYAHIKCHNFMRKIFCTNMLHIFGLTSDQVTVLISNICHHECSLSNHVPPSNQAFWATMHDSTSQCKFLDLVRKRRKAKKYRKI